MVAISGAISQWPIGKLSDALDRRLVIVYCTFASTFFALCAIFASAQIYMPEGLATSKNWFYFFVMLPIQQQRLRQENILLKQSNLLSQELMPNYIY